MAKRRKNGVSPVWAYFVTFLVFFLILGGGVYIFLGDYLGINDFFSGPSSSEEADSGDSDATGLLPGYVPDEGQNLTVLLIGAEERDGIASTFMLLRYLPVQSKIILVPLPWQMTATVGTKTDTLAGFSETGVQSACSAVGNALGITVERYVRFGQDTFFSIADTLGGVNFDVPMDLSIEVREGVFINIAKGEQQLDGTAIARLLNYKEYPEGEPYRYRLQGEVIAALVNSGLQPRLKPLLQTMFNTVVNNTTTNISAADYNMREDALVYTIEYGLEPAYAIEPEGEYNEDFTEFDASDAFKQAVAEQFDLAG